MDRIEKEVKFGLGVHMFDENYVFIGVDVIGELTFVITVQVDP